MGKIGTTAGWSVLKVAETIQTGEAVTLEDTHQKWVDQVCAAATAENRCIAADQIKTNSMIMTTGDSIFKIPLTPIV